MNDKVFGNEYDEIRRAFSKSRCDATVENLMKRGFDARSFSTPEEAVQAVLSVIPRGSQIGAGGSVTLKEIHLLEVLSSRGDEVVYHKPEMEPPLSLSTRKKSITCDYFLTSNNAITIDGELVNTDGIGNRVAGMIFGPKTVIVLAGVNKIVQNLEEAFSRIKNIAAPANARRLGINVPCVSAGKCVECKSPLSICRITTIIHGKPMWTDLKVFLIAEALGL
ncbi:MAG: lactate utilization protein [Actinomycetota bacterium]|nr:lactate utilization protein [Actinomycetota bacterium]